MHFPETSLLNAAINTNLSTAARQLYVHIILTGLLFITSIVLIPWTTVYAADTKTPRVTTPVKWHPGHYYTLMSAGKNNPKHLTQIYKELKETPALRGLQIRYEWAELESAEGVYNFTSIDQRLAELAAQKKRLIVLLQIKSFDPKKALVPDYLKTEIYDGGVFPFKYQHSNVIEGYNIKLWNPQIHNRFVALVSALGKRFNSHPYFEGIGLTETSTGQP
ncbi:MAG: glycoside hydrolase, partial [Nitrosomonas sp.]|nr:glycoside hydrolase [Nitrosomonas sp.]